MTKLNNKFTIPVLTILAFFFGFFLRGLVLPYFQSDFFPINDKLPSSAGCNQIARWHADYLMRKYQIEFNTDSNNPQKVLNQKGGELNGKLLEICNTDPTK